MLVKLMNNENFNGAKAIVASPSVGNVSQLAVDLFIYAVKAEKVGSFWHEAILPLAGGDPYGNKNSLCSANDVYYAPGHNILFIQFRTPLTGSRKTDYLKGLVDWLKQTGVSELVVLAGMFGHSRDDEELSCGTFRYVTCPLSNKLNNECFESSKWFRMRGNLTDEGLACPPLHGAGFTRKLFNISVKESLPCTALLYFCLEGDNYLDAVTFTGKVNQWLNCIAEISKGIKTPPSWEFLFGNPVEYDHLLY